MPLTVPTLECTRFWAIVTLLPLLSKIAPPAPTLALVMFLIQLVLLEPATSLVPLKLMLLLALACVPPAKAAPAVPAVGTAGAPPLRFTRPLTTLFFATTPPAVTTPLSVLGGFGAELGASRLPT